MIALVPANADELVVDGGDPAEQMHLTLAYLGDDVTGMDDATRGQLLVDVGALASATPPVEAEVMGHAAFNPTGAHDREPCAVYLVTAGALPALKAELAGHDVGDHPVFLPHVTAGYGLTPDQLSFVGPVTFDRIRVALADQTHDFPLGEPAEQGQEEAMPETMTAASDTIVEPAGPAVDGEIPINLPVIVIEGLDTSDGRFLAPGSLSFRALPISLLAQPESAHGGDDAGAAGVVGRIDTLTRTPGPEVVSKRTGEPFPEGSFVWSGTGVLMEGAKVGDYDIAKLFTKRFLRGISVDLAGMDYEVLGDDGSPLDPEHPRRQIVTHAAEIAAMTLVPIPAFGDCYAELATDTETLDPVAPEDLPEGLAASATAAWRSSEMGEMCGLCAAGLAEPTGGPMMVARIPANAVDAIAEVIDTGEQRDAQALAEAVVALIADNWSADLEEDADDDLAPGWDESVAAAGPPAELPADVPAEDPVDTEDAADPAAQQPCEFGTEPAVRSLLFRDGEAYVAVCDAHEQDARDTLGASGETVTDVVEIAGGDAEPSNDAEIGDEPIVAAATAPHPPASWFADPQLDGPTALQVGEDGRIFGHLASWGQCHVSFPNQCITAPKSPSGYAYFQVGAVLCDDGNQVPVGHITLDTGHAATHLGQHAAAAHYDNTGTVVADIAAGEDAHGIWVAGALRANVDDTVAAKLRAAALSGDWRRVGGSLELVAALAVNTPGFPVPRARVASGEPLALVAAGVVPVPRPIGGVDRLVAGSLAATEMASVAVAGRTVDPEAFADLIAERLERRRQASELAAQQQALLAELDETPAHFASLLSELDDTPAQFAAALAAFEAGDVDPKASMV
jgi:2'-5' RNA ligase